MKESIINQIIEFFKETEDVFNEELTSLFDELEKAAQ